MPREIVSGDVKMLEWKKKKVLNEIYETVMNPHESESFMQNEMACELMEKLGTRSTEPVHVIDKNTDPVPENAFDRKLVPRGKGLERQLWKGNNTCNEDYRVLVTVGKTMSHVLMCLEPGTQEFDDDDDRWDDEWSP